MAIPLFTHRIVTCMLCTLALLSSITPAVSFADTAEAHQEVVAESTQESAPSLSEEAVEAKKSTSLMGRLLPLPIIITEPAVGEGLGAALVLFHKDKDDEIHRLQSASSITKHVKEKDKPETATAIFGAKTNNGTFGYGIGHQSTILDDTYRIQAAVGRAKVNAKYYLLGLPFKFTLDGYIGFADIKRRLFSTDIFVGLSTSLMSGNADFKISKEESEDYSLFDFDFTDNALGLNASYDSRDLKGMPKNGQHIKFDIWQHSKSLGGDFNYTIYNLKMNTFHQFGGFYVLAARLDTQYTGSDSTPFFAQPFVQLRGIPALRYQGLSAMTFEVENRFILSERWNISVFGGTGVVDFTESDPIFEEDIYSYGTGFRFKALKKQSAWVGFDVARGPEDWA